MKKTRLVNEVIKTMQGIKKALLENDEDTSPIENVQIYLSSEDGSIIELQIEPLGRKIEKRIRQYETAEALEEARVQELESELESEMEKPIEDDELGEAYSNWVEMQVENGNILLN